MFAASAAVAETAPNDAALKIACEGALGRGSSHAMLVKTFGSDNVKYGKIKIADNTVGIFVSIVFPNDAKRRLEVFWENNKARRTIHALRIAGASRWTAPNGIRIGTPLVEVEALNGKPFTIGGFGWDYGGTVQWNGGTLDGPVGKRCFLAVILAPKNDAPAAALNQVSGEGPHFASNDPNMIAVSPTVYEFYLNYD